MLPILIISSPLKDLIIQTENKTCKERNEERERKTDAGREVWKDTG